MGLKNYITNDVYVTVTNVMYFKHNRALRFDIAFFKDSTKTVPLGSSQFEITGYRQLRRVSGYSKVAPKDPNDGDVWIVQPNAIKEWEGRDGLFAIWSAEEAAWKFWHWGDDEIIYFIPLKRYCVFDEKNFLLTPAPIQRIDDIDWWESWFGPDVVFGSATTNLYRQIYSYLKQVPGFENTVDC